MELVLLIRVFWALMLLKKRNETIKSKEANFPMLKKFGLSKNTQPNLQFI